MLLEISLLFLVIVLNFLNIWNLAVVLLILFLILENLFTIYKIYKKQILKPKFTSRLLLILCVSYLIQLLILLVFFTSKYWIYILLIFLIWQIDLIWIWILLVSPISNWQRKKIISKAKDKIWKLPNLITIWITWSCWKSSTKEILAHILSSKYKVISTPENKNTPLWISNCIINDIKNDTQIFVCEMWAYCMWEIRELWEIVNHKHWIITEISNHHIWLFKGQQKIIKGKFELSEKIIENKWNLYINWDSENCIKWLKKINSINIIKYSIKNQDIESYWQIISESDHGSRFLFRKNNKSYKFTSNLIWQHNILNLTWALSACFDLWLSESEINRKLNNINLLSTTFKIIKIKDSIIIDSTYNSNYLWILANCKTLENFKQYTKILVIDDILELWNQSKNTHSKLWKKLWEFDFDKIIIVWKNYWKEIKDGLINAWYNQKNISLNPKSNSFIKELINLKTCILFQWRESKKYIPTKSKSL